MINGYQIIRAALSDTATITAQRCAMFEAMGVVTPEKSRAIAVAFEPWLRRQMEAGTYLGWFQKAADGSIVAGAGLMLLDWPPGHLDLGELRGYLLNVYTHPDHRRRGLAAGLVQEIVEYCRDRRIQVVSLHASHDGRGVYERLGFEPTNEMRILL